MAEIVTVQAGALATNCHLIGDPTTRKCVVVDAGGDPARIAEAIEATGWTVEYILATHGHADHTGAVAGILETFGGRFAAGRADVDLIMNPPEWLVEVLLDFRQPPQPEVLLDGGETVCVGRSEIKVLATPGHTPGSICYLVEEVVLTGDTLFKGSIGRYDLPGGDGDQELASITGVLMSLNDSVEVRPGHGPSTTIGQERRSNPFLRS